MPVENAASNVGCRIARGRDTTAMCPSTSRCACAHARCARSSSFPRSAAPSTRRTQARPSPLARNAHSRTTVVAPPHRLAQARPHLDLRRTAHALIDGVGAPAVTSALRDADDARSRSAHHPSKQPRLAVDVASNGIDGFCRQAPSIWRAAALTAFVAKAPRAAKIRQDPPRFFGGVALTRRVLAYRARLIAVTVAVFRGCGCPCPSRCPFVAPPARRGCSVVRDALRDPTRPPEAQRARHRVRSQSLTLSRTARLRSGGTSRVRAPR